MANGHEGNHDDSVTDDIDDVFVTVLTDGGDVDTPARAAAATAPPAASAATVSVPSSSRTESSFGTDPSLDADLSVDDGSRQQQHPRQIGPGGGRQMEPDDAQDDIDAFLSGEMERMAILPSTTYPRQSVHSLPAAAAPRGRLAAAVPRQEEQEKMSRAMIANELYRTPFHEREQASQDLHGVIEPVEETAEVVRDALRRMDVVIQARCHPNHAYRRALHRATAAAGPTRDGTTRWLHSSGPEADSFRLAFLRTDRFDARQAAERYLAYFELKESLFGPERLTQRDIRLDDLDDDCRARMESGKTQLLPGRDARGRAVIISVGRLHQEFLSSTSSSRNGLSEEEEIRNEVSCSCHGTQLLLVEDNFPFFGSSTVLWFVACFSCVLF